jgi:HPt (histidine-containing phosphotransfer) domain-containing protein
MVTNKGIPLEMQAREQERIIVVADPDLADLIPGFIENRRHDISSLTAALEQGDYEAIRVLGHGMKGFGKSYGFAEITEIGSRLEQAAKERAAETITRDVEELATYLERVQVVYE